MGAYWEMEKKGWSTESKLLRVNFNGLSESGELRSKQKCSECERIKHMKSFKKDSACKRNLYIRYWDIMNADNTVKS